MSLTVKRPAGHEYDAYGFIHATGLVLIDVQKYKLVGWQGAYSHDQKSLCCFVLSKAMVPFQRCPASLPQGIGTRMSPQAEG